MTLRAQDVYAYLRSLDGGWVDWENTVDTWKAGDPNAPVRGIGVMWMPYWSDLKRAAGDGCNLIVTHEPVYYNHRDQDETIFQRLLAARNKREWIAAQGLVILRCHDLWDQLPRVGIPDSWGETLGLGQPIAGKGWFRVYNVAGETAGSLARRLAERVAPLGQEAVQLIGEPSWPVSRLAIGTGAITPLWTFLNEWEADCAVCTDDGFSYWRDGAYALDAGIPVIVVNHTTSEVPGISRLAQQLREAFPETPVREYPQRPPYRLVWAKPLS
ncbi:MAG: hypothetical protein KatS3mg115_2533 [Candidatus Poribacteria bacterium]|nr:MAG: hypothetical protein KatS3mg115_2533 [Candidatus Poribacteria bacterium]